MTQTFAITRKELSSYFGSPMALIFLGVFLIATFFTFFSIDAFFARDIADVRPLFRWMPALLIFLGAALTMRQWSEEQKSGTMEILLTLPVHPWQLVLGKFLAVLALIGIALALTFSLPLTVTLLGNLDWGPVIGGYLAALLMAAAYTAIGLFVSSRTDNQIVALILTVVLSGILLLIGAESLVEFIGGALGAIFSLVRLGETLNTLTINVMQALSTASRFESIQRGVIDIRDLIYYLSLTALFLSLNVLSLDYKRWSLGRHTATYRRNAWLGLGLVAINLILLNVWLYPLNGIRLDLTEQGEYTLSNTTAELLSNLNEPLLIRAYLSERTHPLLAPLTPRIEDMLREYAVTGGGNVTVEIVDPATNPDLEAEANQTYGIRPSPFQVSGRYEAAIVNAYFDILIRYGDQREVLNFRDLIEVESFRDGQVDVRLRNLEYDLTRTVKKTVYGFQSIDAVLATLDEPARLTLLITPDTLPESYQAAQTTIAQIAEEITQEANGKFIYETIDPTAPNSPLNPQTLYDTYGVQPFPVSLFATESYYLHMLLQVGNEIQVIFPGGDVTEGEIRSNLEAGLKHGSPGFLKVVGVWQPTIAPDPTMAQLGQNQQPPFSTWNTLSEYLRQDYEVRAVDLSTGEVPPEIDVLIVAAPQGIDEVQRYAIDQYLMRGGALIVAANSYKVTVDVFQGTLAAEPITDGLQDMLDFYGVNLGDGFVLDPQNEAFPITTQRNGVPILQSIAYPYFVDVRADGMTETSPIIASLPAVTLNWASPLTLDEAKNEGRQTVNILQSSPESWVSETPILQPDLDVYPEYGFPIGDEQAAQSLAVSVRGRFESFFADKEPPQVTTPSPDGSPPTLPPTISESPETARLVVIGSGYFINDTVFSLSQQTSFDRYLNSLQFIANGIDWSVEEADLLNIRTRGSHARLLQPLERNEQIVWEAGNYIFVIVALIAIGGVWYVLRRNEKPMNLTINH